MLSEVPWYDFFDVLARQAPDDADAIVEAKARLEKQRIATVARLASLSDAHWQRIDIEIGVEALIRSTLEELQNRSAAEESVDHAGLLQERHTGGGQSGAGAADAELRLRKPHMNRSTQRGGTRTTGTTLLEHDERNEVNMLSSSYNGITYEKKFDFSSSSTSTSSTAAAATQLFSDAEQQQLLLSQESDLRAGKSGFDFHSNTARPGAAAREEGHDLDQSGHLQTGTMNTTAPPFQLEPPENLEELWENLLLETLPPDKRDVLQQQWVDTPTVEEKFMMLLEYNSYLRRPHVSPEERAERRKQLAPLLAHYGIPADEFDQQNEDSDEYGSGLKGRSDTFFARNLGFFLALCFGLLLSSVAYVAIYGLPTEVGRLNPFGGREGVGKTSRSQLRSRQNLRPFQGIHEEQL
ncbi:unnamed protein product [Amoebophrya sp. A120]|nr:unnamed protein product [Amoebophrya sp. A120]|eukprot:GSA120T00003732001.1